METIKVKREFSVEAPWYTWRKKIYKLFELDPEITVANDFNEIADRVYQLDISTTNHEKFIALQRVLPHTKAFGNITVLHHLIDDSGVNPTSSIEVYETLFQGNPILKDVKDVVDVFDTHHGYVRFWPQVLQFFNDDLTDYNGNWSGLAQDIARELFDNLSIDVTFCTAPVEEN